MAIDSIGGRTPPNSVSPKLSTEPTVKNTTTQPTVGDTVETPITDKIKSALASSNESPVNSERVNSIKQTITDGSYTVDADRIAEKMLQFEKSLPE
jgi:negative regulator of flagellin synthesis FlgM